jgi:hypothetical protein
MATKRRFTREELATAIEQNGGNVKHIAAAYSCTVKTVYNNLDRYNMRSELDRVRESTITEATRKLQTAPRGVRVALMALVQSTGAIDHADLAQILGEV